MFNLEGRVHSVKRGLEHHGHRTEGLDRKLFFMSRLLEMRLDVISYFYVPVTFGVLFFIASWTQNRRPGQKKIPFFENNKQLPVLT